MRDVNLESFEVGAHHTYFGHVSSSMEADGVGLTIMHVDHGRLPCCGVDSDLEDGYQGDILLDSGGHPYNDVTVQYCRDELIEADSRQAKDIVETITDSEGKHEVWLAPGRYCYHYVNAIGVATSSKIIEVQSSRVVSWENIDGEGATASISREIGLVVEDLICHWSMLDGQPFGWPDVEHTIAQISRKILASRAGLRYITFDKMFCKPDLVWSLQAQGVPAWPSDLTDLQMAAAYRNMTSLGHAECLVLLDHDQANYQLRRSALYVTDKRVTAPPGEQKYLADMRAACVHYAAQAAAMEQPQTIASNPYDRISETLGKGLGQEQSLRQVVSMFEHKSRKLPPVVRNVPVGEKSQTVHNAPAINCTVTSKDFGRRCTNE